MDVGPRARRVQAAMLAWQAAAVTSRWRRLAGGGARTTGYPTSSNRASSFHLRWGGLPPAVAWVAVEATLEVLMAPQVAELHFWALQASFRDGARHTGAGHLGLQWHPAHPRARAANWGGYDADGGELRGSPSPLPSATGNLNTRDFPWEPRRRHTLGISAGSAGGRWAGAVDGTVLRELDGGGRTLDGFTVWSEVFSRCDDPSVVVRWSNLRARAGDGTWHRPDRVVVSYQSHAEGGCAATTVADDGAGLLQITNTERLVPAGATLPVPE